MEEDLTSDLSQYQLSNVEVPLSHDIPKTTLESLIQVKKEFELKIDDATEKNDTSKKSRYKRQLAQFETAIKALKAGKNFDYSSLQVPPGFARIPLTSDGRPVLTSSSSSSNLSVASRPVQKSSPQPEKKLQMVNDEADDDLLAQLENEIDSDDDDDDGPLDPEEEKFNQQIRAAQKFIPKMDIPKEELPKKKSKQSIVEIPQFPPVDNQLEIPQIPAPKPQVPNSGPKPAIQIGKSNTQHNKQLQIILERQRLFKEAALKAKQDGSTSVALVYLRHAKGFDSMISAAENGLPIDMSNLPVPPQLEGSVKKTVSPQAGSSILSKQMNACKLMTDDLVIPVNGDRKVVYKHLSDQLREQFEIANRNFKHFTNMGDVGNANKFKKIGLETVQDLEALKNAEKLNEPVPLYHYEKRVYETIDCNSDLTDNDLEIEIIRAVNLSMPKDYKVDHMNTFVKFEFPFPPEEAQTDKTKPQYASVNPEYNQSFKLQIQRKQSKFIRMMNRKELKLEIYIKGGFLRSDKLLASCGVKLQPLENSSSLHNAYDLMEGRRSTGSKIEVKIRIREPLLHRGVKTIENNWLMIDKFQHASSVKM